MNNKNLFDVIEYIKNMQKETYSFFAEDFAFYLYGLIKMTNPSTILELGTGFGTTSFMAAQACKENGHGKVITVDNGSQINNFENYSSFIKNQISVLDLNNFIDFREFDIDLIKMNGLDDIDQVDIFFNDIDAGFVYLISTLSWVIPRVKGECYFFIDNGASFAPTYLLIEKLCNDLNYGKVPKSIYQMSDQPDKLEGMVKTLKFSSHYVKKNNNNGNNQDSFALIKIEENDI